MKPRAVFLDRDGVINKSIVIDGHPKSPKDISEFEILQGVDLAINHLKRMNFEIVVVSNQPDISRGIQKRENIWKMQEEIQNKLNIEFFYTCFHDDADLCDCRKPLPGMLISAAKDLNLDLKSSYMVGDRWRDIQAGQDVGCKCFFINNFYAEKQPQPPYIEVYSLLEATLEIWKAFNVEVNL
jgi:D-glycero-D-manno-heptose 1,7-bisphosphate phosphatase